MNVNFSAAANAYSAVQKVANNSSTSGTSGTSSTGGAGFADMVADAAKSAVNTIKSSEKASMDAVSGKAGINDVVLAVNSADIALKSVIAVRDKVINAYQDIIKMPI